MSTGSVRSRYVATYLYPGVFMPEEVSRQVQAATLAAVVAEQPDDPESTWFARDRWYAVTVDEVIEERYASDDGDVRWLTKSRSTIDSWIVGERIALTDPRTDSDPSGALRANLAQYERLGGPGGKTSDGVLCRTGNWQPAAAYGHVVSDQDAR